MEGLGLRVQGWGWRIGLFSEGPYQTKYANLGDSYNEL